MEYSGKALTVTGPVSPDSLGRTLPHEHLSIKYDKAYVDPPKGDMHMVDKAFSLETFNWILKHPYSCKANLSLYGAEDAILQEMKDFKMNGGGTIVENSIRGLDRDMQFLVHAANVSGVNIIAGTGFYYDDFLMESVRQASVEQLAAQMRTDILEGWNGTSARCGVIGEVGVSYPITGFERRSLQASAIVQNELGAPLIIHPGRDPKAPEETLRLLSEFGADLSKTIMSHLDRTLSTDAQVLELAKMGCILEYDLFGLEESNYQKGETFDMPNDGMRLRYMKLLVDEGYGDSLVMAQDIHTRHRLTKFGGHGYSHIFRYMIPKMLLRGFSQDVVDQITIHTPRKWLTFK